MSHSFVGNQEQWQYNDMGFTTFTRSDAHDALKQSMGCDLRSRWGG